MSEENVSVGEIEGAVRLHVAGVNRARVDPRHVLTVTLSSTQQQQNSQFSSETSLAFSLRKCSKLEKGVTDSVISQQECDRKLPLTGGQGYQRCMCRSKC